MSAPTQQSITKRVLVAEDDPSIRELLERCLSREYEVMVAKDGHEALALATKKPHPHLVLLDVMMPGVDGFGVAARLKMAPDTKRIPVIFLTAKDGAQDVIRGIQAGARHYITKPFTVSDVLSKVKKALGD